MLEQKPRDLKRLQNLGFAPLVGTFRYPVLIITILLCSNYLFGQKQSRIINYPIELIYSKCLKDCVETYDMNLKKVKQYENTFISTPEFCERFVMCDPIVFEIYSRNDLKLYELDSLTANYYNSLATDIGDIIVINAETNEEDTSSFFNLYLDFKKFSADKMGNLQLLDYSEINIESKTIESDLEKLGLKKHEIDYFFELLE